MSEAEPHRPSSYRFGSFVLDLHRGELRTMDGPAIPLRPKGFALLQLLAGNAGRLIARDLIMQVVWPGVFVTDDSIAQCISEIRRALGAEARQLVRALPRRGYVLEA